MFICPNCSVPLLKTQATVGMLWVCPSCDGRAAAFPLLRRKVPNSVVNKLWMTARAAGYSSARHCPVCNRVMAEIPASLEHQTERLDVCTACQFIWFDHGEYESLPVITRQPDFEEQLPQEAREKLAIIQLEKIREDARGKDWGEDSPDEWWKWIPGLLGMPVEYETADVIRIPWLTWSLAFATFVVSVSAFFNLEKIVEIFGLIPSRCWRYGGLTFITSFFLHGGSLHLVSNLYFFVLFGDNVEDWLGKWRFILLLVLSTIAGGLAHIIGDPYSTIPCIGASGGISGIITFYALRFPRARIGFLARAYVYVRWIHMPAYAMLLVWVVIQLLGVETQMSGFSNISSLAHLGGAGAGFIFWLVTRKK